MVLEKSWRKGVVADRMAKINTKNKGQRAGFCKRGIVFFTVYKSDLYKKWKNIEYYI